MTRQPRGEDGNAGGDLDVTESLVVRGKGLRTVVENALGDPAIPGNGGRLFHVDQHGEGGVDVAFEHLTLARGDVGCTGARCSTGGSAIEQHGSGALRFPACRVPRNGASCTGEECGGTFDGTPIHTLFGGALTVRKTRIKSSHVRCASDSCTLGAAAIAMATDGGVPLSPAATASSGALEMTRVTIAENVASCEGNGCSAGRVVGVFAESVAVQRLVVASNELRCSGDGCAVRALVDRYAQGSALIDGAELTDNLGDCVGEAASWMPRCRSAASRQRCAPRACSVIARPARASRASSRCATASAADPWRRERSRSPTTW
ncbi:MAG: hypothetical protein FJ148_03885 [Deltaproteobacteria bacterium]|nr:hypothetical protein [Deltaproteobacteria bacterium]